jgi:hypothetical protein
MSSSPDPSSEISSSFIALSDQMRQRKVDVLTQMRRIVEERTGKTFTPEEFAELVLSSQSDRQHTPGQAVADMQSMAEDHRCQGNVELAAGLNGLADLAKRLLND